jgi:antiviral defense system Shedu protein SduA
LQGTVHRAVTQIGERIQSTGTDGADVPDDVTYLLQPRGFVVAGQLSQFTGTSGGEHRDKIRSFELFRRQLREPDVLTFDEVLARAEWAVDLAEAAN